MLPRAQSGEPKPDPALSSELRRRQVLGLLIVAAVVLAFSAWRARHILFSPGWWRIW